MKNLTYFLNTLAALVAASTVALATDPNPPAPVTRVNRLLSLAPSGKIELDSPIVFSSPDDIAALAADLAVAGGTAGVASINGRTGVVTVPILAPTSVAAGSYGDTSHSVTLTVDAYGRLTGAANVAITPTAIGAQPLAANLSALANNTTTTISDGNITLHLEAVSGDGSLLTSLAAAQVTGAHMLPDAVLSLNVPRYDDATPIFAGVLSAATVGAGDMSAPTIEANNELTSNVVSYFSTDHIGGTQIYILGYPAQEGNYIEIWDSTGTPQTWFDGGFNLDLNGHELLNVGDGGISFAGTGAADTRTALALVPGANVQPYSANLSAFAGIAPSANVQTLLGAANYAAFKTSLSLNSVENTALSTWAGSSHLTTLGTLTGGATGAGFTVALGASTVTGTLPGANFPALTGDITTTAGSLATSIGAGKVTNAMLAGSIDLTTKVTGVLPLANRGASYGRVTSDYTATTGTFSSPTTDVTGLSWSVAAGENWCADATLYCISGTSGQGFKFRVTGPASPTSVLIEISGTGSSGSSTIESEVQTSFSATPGKNFVTGSTLTGVVRIHIVVINGSNAGTVQLQAANSAGSSTVTIKTNSDLLATKTN